VAMAIAHGEHGVIDTTESPARVWVAPSEGRVHEARTRLAELARTRQEGEAHVVALAAALGVELHVNIGSLQERVPRGALGVGLLRTELVFAGRHRAPGEPEQVAAMLAVARAARGGVVTARLFDAGGDKPLPWLSVPPAAGDVRGIALLLLHPEVLEAQLRAMVRASAHAAVRALVPMTRSADDIEAVRRRADGLAVGAMIETPEAVRDIDAIAAAADFVCIGTNDLAAFILGGSRAGADRALDPRVLVQIAAIVRGAHARGRKVTVCGEVAADPRGACLLVGMGVDALSVAAGRLGEVALALRDASKKDCERDARAALAMLETE
jgi:phosphoenolpyruvate-protein kinase (PTS system EI component)